MADVEVLVAHQERVTLRVGEVFVKVDADQGRLDTEVAAMELAPVPTPTVLWHRPPALGLAALAGGALGQLGRPTVASPAAWRAAGAAVRALHDAPLPPWPSRVDASATTLDDECDWIVASGLLPFDVVRRNRTIADAALVPQPPVFAHGDLQPAHVFVDGYEVTGVLDWSEAGRGDAMYDLAVLTLGHPDRLADVADGYGADHVAEERVHAWWSARCLLALRWLVEHGYDPAAPGCEVDVLRAAR